MKPQHRTSPIIRCTPSLTWRAYAIRPYINLENLKTPLYPGAEQRFFNDDSYRFKRGLNDLLFCNLTNLIDYINRQVFLPESEA